VFVFVNQAQTCEFHPKTHTHTHTHHTYTHLSATSSKSKRTGACPRFESCSPIQSALLARVFKLMPTLRILSFYFMLALLSLASSQGQQRARHHLQLARVSRGSGQIPHGLPHHNMMSSYARVGALCTLLFTLTTKMRQHPQVATTQKRNKLQREIASPVPMEKVHTTRANAQINKHTHACTHIHTLTITHLVGGCDAHPGTYFGTRLWTLGMPVYPLPFIIAVFQSQQTSIEFY
jgi:hypothetical protein